MSIEIRHVVVGDCDCGTPKFDWEFSEEHRHHWQCDYGRIPSFDINNPAPLAVVGRDWVHDVFKEGGQRRTGERLHTITMMPTPDENGDITENSEVRIFHHLEYQGRRWTWQLESAHWADPPTRYNNAHTAIYLGRWPD